MNFSLTDFAFKDALRPVHGTCSDNSWIYVFFFSLFSKFFLKYIFFLSKGTGGRGGGEGDMDVRLSNITPPPGVISVFRLSSYRLQMFNFTWRKRLHHMCFLESFLKFWGQLLLVFLIFCQPQVARYLWINYRRGFQLDYENALLWRTCVKCAWAPPALGRRGMRKQQCKTERYSTQHTTQHTHQ